MRYSEAKCVALLACMVTLGNLLASISMYVGRSHPQVALDFSHLATAIIAIRLGPGMGVITGALVGIVSFYQFGVVGWLGPFLGFLSIVLGRALSGLFFGLLSSRLRPFKAVAIGFIPESLYTYIALKYLTHLLLPPQIASGFTDNLIIFILTKAWIAIIIIGAIVDIITTRKVVEAVLAT
ncbi:MAG: hypothetical protein ACUVUB_02350 [Candidatus Bathyarchaeia archaeon]